MDIFVPPGHEGGASPGEMVSVEITRWPTSARGAARPRVRRARRCRCARRRHRDHHPQIRHPRRALGRSRERGSASGNGRLGKDLRGRTDFRAVPTVTIDGEHARDFDDAITIEKLPNGHYWLGVHIADVSHYVHEGSALDREAYERATSVYFPERAVHMFPSELATGLVQPEPARRSPRAVVPDGSRPARPGRPLRISRRRHQQQRADDLHRRQRHPHRSRSRRC